MNINNDEEVFEDLLAYWSRIVDNLLVEFNMAQRFNAVARSNDELNDLTAEVRKLDRQGLTAREREKLHQYAIAELPTKFSLLSLSDDKEQLSNTYNIMRRKQELFSRLDKYDMSETFTRVLTFDANGDLVQNGEKSLRDNSIGATLEEVARSNQHYNQFGQDYDVQDLNWSQELLENSCDATLRDKVMENLAQYPRVQHGGPLFYRIMMGLITTTTAEATRMMITRISTMKIRDIQGEDVGKAVSSIRGALQHLETAQAVPNDIRNILIDIFTKTSVPDFNSIFSVLNSQMKIDNTFQLTIERILNLAETNYMDMKERGVWNAPTQVRGLITCWNCNEEGHSAKKCPKPRNEKNVNDNKAKFDQAKGERTSTGRGGGRGGRGRGRNSYSGRGRGGGRSGGPNTEEGKGPIDIMKTPPMRKGMTVMNINGTTHYWCHKCSCWNTNHGTADHPETSSTSTPTTSETTTKVPSTKQTNLGTVSSSFRDTIFQGTRGAN